MPSTEDGSPRYPCGQWCSNIPAVEARLREDVNPQLSVACGGPRCGGQEEKESGTIFRPKGSNPVSRRWLPPAAVLEGENGEELRLRGSSLASSVVVVRR